MTTEADPPVIDLTDGIADNMTAAVGGRSSKVGCIISR